ncbi:hypothetical protein ACQ4LE_002201 [Meloidogyne hapla]
MFWWIVLILILILLTTLYFLFIHNSGISRCSSSEEIFDGNQENNSGLTKDNKEKRNVFKSIYSNIMVKRSASLTSLPLLLRRRHSTVGSGFPKQVIRAAKKIIPDFRQKFSVSSPRDALPKPPSEFFEPLENPQVPDRQKPLFYLKQNTKLLEFPSFCNIKEEDIQLMVFDTNEFIVKPGDADDSIYVVLEGCLAVYISPTEGKKSLVRRIGPSDCFFSPLSLLDIFMGKPSLLKTVSLKSTLKTRLAKYSLVNFYNAFIENPDQSAWIRTIQIIATRLRHIVLTTLHQHLGLGEELVNKHSTSSNKKPLKQRGLSLRNYGGGLKPKLQRMSTEFENSNEETKISVALTYFCEALNISEADGNILIKPYLRFLKLEENQTLYEEGNNDGASIGVVVSGLLKITQESVFPDVSSFGCDDKDSWCAYVNTRELVGGLQFLTDEPSFCTLRAACPSIVALIDKKDADVLIERKPSLVFPIAYSVLQRLSSFVRAIDFALGWVLLDSGEALYRKNDFSDSVFVALSGRLRSVSDKIVIEEFGRGDVLGIVEVLQQNPRSTTVLAVRYSQLAKIPEGLLNFVKMQFPQVGFRLVRLLGRYYSGRVSSSSALAIPDPMTQRNLHTIAIFPATFDVPLVAFTCELYHALSVTTKIIRLSSKFVVERLGVEAVMQRKADFRLMHWLNSQEDTYQLVIYECDYTATNWTRRCLSQADAIIVVACGDQKPPEKHFIDEHLKMNQDGIRSRKELVLLWRGKDAVPKGTYEWLKGSWFSAHHHIHAPDRMFSWESKVEKNENEILDFYEHHVFPFNIDVHSDFARLGRLLSSNAVGLVLGGGGARGAAHIGLIKALYEHGIPVDIVGGTSIGSMISGVLATNPNNMKNLEEKVSNWFLGMSSFWNLLLDITWAFSARLTGYNFNKLLKNVFGFKSIEDLWLLYFCVTTDISNSEMRVHRNGQLWRYVRASMTLAVYLPPICDDEDGHYLLDGGYVNNLPADVMRTMGARTVIAIDVSSADEKDFHNYGDYLNGFYAQFHSLFWQKDAMRILTAQEIQDRLSFVSSVRQLESIKKAPYCTYLRPPIDRFKTLDFPKFNIIQNAGYQYGCETLPELITKNNHLKTLINHGKFSVMRYSPNTFRKGSFTDLAAQISRIPSQHCRSLDDFSKYIEDEDNEDEEYFEHEEDDSDRGLSNEFILPDEDVILINATIDARITTNIET